MSNDFIPFATGGGANVLSPSAYAASGFVPTGFVAGLAPSQQLNTVWRQSAFMTAALAAWAVALTGSSALDNGNLATMQALIAAAVKAQAGTGVAPQTTVLTSGSGTYTTPTGATRLEIDMVGGGSGGAGGGTSPGTSGAGGNTTIDSMTANGGAATVPLSFSTPATATGGDINVSGERGSPGVSSNSGGSIFNGGHGASSFFGGGAPGTMVSTPPAAVVFGSGGAGGSAAVSSIVSGWGGNSGAYCKKIITSPLATYAYTVGAAGSAGSAGTNGTIGSVGAAGMIRIVAYFN